MNLIHYLLLAINPILGFFASLFSFDKRSTKNVLWFFTMLYGYTFVISNDTMDANRRRGWYELITGQHLGWFDTLKYFYIDNENATDFIEPLIYSISAQFFPTFNGLMFVLGCIFGFFYSRNVVSVYKILLSSRINAFGVLFFLCFPFVIGFWEINMFRFFICAIIYFYAIFPFLYSGSKQKLLLLLVVPFIHFSFWLPVLIFFFFYITKIRIKLFFTILIVGALFSFIDISFLGNIVKVVLPGNFHSKIDLYTNKDYYFGREEVARNWAYYAKTLFYYAQFFLLFFFYKKKIKEILSDTQMKIFYSFCLLFSGFCFLLYALPEGDRFVRVASLFNLCFFVFYLSKYPTPNFLRIGNVLLLPIVLLFIFAFIRDSFNTLNAGLLFNNTFLLIYDNGGKALIEFF